MRRVSTFLFVCVSLLVCLTASAQTKQPAQAAHLSSALAGASRLNCWLRTSKYYRTYKLNYHGGERYPHLERITGQPDLLNQIIKSHAPH